MGKHVILGVHITDRVKHAGEVQKALTEYGCSIKTRIGLHEVSEKQCASGGIVLLEIFGVEKKADELMKRLNAVEGVEVKKMVFED